MHLDNQHLGQPGQTQTCQHACVHTHNWSDPTQHAWKDASGTCCGRLYWCVAEWCCMHVTMQQVASICTVRLKRPMFPGRKHSPPHVWAHAAASLMQQQTETEHDAFSTPHNYQLKAVNASISRQACSAKQHYDPCKCIPLLSLLKVRPSAVGGHTADCCACMHSTMLNCQPC